MVPWGTLCMVCSVCIIYHMTQKAYRFRFYPTLDQIDQLAIEFGHARFVWNHALDMRSKAYHRRGESLNYVPLGKHITRLKNTRRFEWLKDCTSAVLTQRLIDLDTAFINFFKHGAKYPNFKKKLHKQSVRYPLDQRQIARTYAAGELLKLPKLGAVNIKWSQLPDGTPKMVTVSKTSTGKYFVSFSCAVEIKEMPKTGRSVGIDMGIKDVIVTSDGVFSGALKFTKKYEASLRRANKDLSRKTKGSNRWHKQRIVTARVHEKITNSRNDFAHKLTTGLIEQYDAIYIEDLNVSGMVKNRRLAKAISDVGMFEIKRQLEYKAGWYGRTVLKIDRWFPSSKTCSGCGQIHDMPLNKREMNCDCGLIMDRDLNAAHNIKAAGIVAHGEKSADAGLCTA